MVYTRFEQQELILRDELAIDRTRLANERTFLAYVRTALALAIVGGTCIHLFPNSRPLFSLGILFFIAAAVCLAIGTWKTVAMTKQIQLLRKHPR
ncbi:MAG: DUF202 domain-containing protein [Planctomycetales bacterium]|nr:DUF202 domain-containing protein [Planctomycetales bacterium]